MDEFYTKCLEIGKSNRIKESQTQLSQFLRKNSYFRSYEKTNTNLDFYTRNYSQFLRFETFQVGKIIYTISPPKQFYIIQGRALVIAPKKESSQILFNNYIERVIKKIKKGNFSLDEEDEDCPSKDYYKNQLILKPGDGFGELQFTRTVIIAIDELNVFTCLSNHYQKCFEQILTRNTFITEQLIKILPLIDKNEIANEIAPLFIEHSISSFEGIFQRNQKISQFYILRQGFCEIYLEQTDQVENDNTKKPSIAIKQGELFGHEDCTGSSNLRVFSCRSISPNTIIYAIDKDSLMNNKNQKIRSLILNNAFSKYHYYMQNFKSRGLQIRQEKNVMVRSSLTSLSNIPQSQLPNLQNQAIQSTTNISQSSTQKQEKTFQSPQSLKMISSARTYHKGDKSYNEIKTTLNQSSQNFKVNIIKNIPQNNSENKSQQLQQQQQKAIPQNELLQTPKKLDYLSPLSYLEKKSNTATLTQNSTNLIQQNQEKKQEAETITAEEEKSKVKSDKKIDQQQQNNNINLQANIDYIKSLRVSNEAHKFKNSSLLSFFSPQQPNSNTSLTHLDDTMEETEKLSINQQNQQKSYHPLSSNCISDNKQSSQVNQINNNKVTRNFKLLNEVEDLDSSASIANDLDNEDEIFQKNLYGGKQLNKKPQIQIKNKSSTSNTNFSKKEIYQKVKKQFQMFCADKKVRFKGLEEINIQNFNNYDDITNINNKFSSMQVLPELQSPIKSILRKRSQVSVEVTQSVNSTPIISQSKFTIKALKQLEGITQQRIIPNKKKSLTQKNQIIQQINQKS